MSGIKKKRRKKMGTIRKRHSASFKANVALEAVKELRKQYGIASRDCLHVVSIKVKEVA